MKEYKLSTGWAVFLYLFVAAMYIGAIWLIIFPFTSHDAGSYNKLLWSIPVALAIIVFATYSLLEVIKGRLIIEDDKVYTISATGRRHCCLVK